MASTTTSLSLFEHVSEPNFSRDAQGSDTESDGNSDVSDEGLADTDEDIDFEVDDDKDVITTNSGWADAMAKILKINKPKGKKSIVLAKAKKLNDVVQKDKGTELSFEVDGEVKEKKPDPNIIDKKPELELLAEQMRRKKREWYSKGRQKPDILDKDRERTLAKIGTKGVVQLFNAVRQQQKVIEDKLQDTSVGPARREKIMKTINKQAFLDVVMGSAKSLPVDNPVKEEKEYKEEDGKPMSWDVLRDNFMMGGQYKDWDRNEPKENSDEPMSETDSDSSS